MSDAAPPRSLIRAIAASAGQRRDRVAFRQKRRGIWIEIGYGRLLERVGNLAHGLSRLGVGPGETVVLAGENTLDVAIADLAVQAVGAATLHVPPRLATGRFAEVLATARARVAICGDQEQLDGVAADPGSVTKVVMIRPAGLAHPAALELTDLASLERGPQRGGGLEDMLDSRSSDEVARRWVAAASFEDLGIVSHRSRDLLDRAEEFRRELALAPDDRLISIVSLARPCAALIDVYATLLGGATLHFPESPATVAEDLAQMRPTVLHANGRALALLRIGESRARAETGRLSGALLDWARGKLEPGGAGPSQALAYWGVARRTARKLGLAGCRLVAVSEGGGHAKDRRFVKALRIPLACIGGTTAQPGPVRASGDEEAGTGTTVAARIEDAATENPFVRWAMLHGRADKARLAVQIEFEPVAGWALARGLSFSSYASLVRLEPVREKIGSGIAEALKRVAPGGAAPEIVLLEKECDESAGQLGADLLPRRAVIAAMLRESEQP